MNGSLGTSGDKAPRERLATRTWARFAEDPDDTAWTCGAVSAVAAGIAPGGVNLGPLAIAGGAVVPVVTFHDGVLESRVKLGVEPAIDRVSLRELLERGGAAGTSPVADVVFVGLLGLTKSATMSRLSGYGRCVLIAPLGRDADPLELAECDWRGLGVVNVDTLQSIRWLVPPSPALDAPSAMTNLRQEQLLDVAWRASRSLSSRVDRLSR